MKTISRRSSEAKKVSYNPTKHWLQPIDDKFNFLRVIFFNLCWILKKKLLVKYNLSTDLCTFIKLSLNSCNSWFFLNFCKKNILRRYKVSVLQYKMSLNRPLSPHLSIHKKVLTAVFSIFHRFTGICLSLGAILLSVWIILIALGPDYYSKFQSLSSLIFFKIFLFLWTLTIFYHLYNGIRYLFWSYGKMMELSTVYKTGYVVIILSILSTILVWVSIWKIMPLNG